MLGGMGIGAARGAYVRATLSAASRSWLPMTTRSGCMKSCIAEPSRKNSGLETTAASWPRGCLRSTLVTMSPVSGGTVDLLMTTIGPSLQAAIEFAALALGRADGDEGVVGTRHGILVGGGELQAAGLCVAFDELAQSRLVKGH